MMTQSQRTILIVDDFPQDRETYRRYLSSDPDVAYTILEAESAEDGLALCQLQQLDGILLDFLLPDLDGLQFLAMLKAKVGESYPPIVMVSGQGNESIAVQAIKGGAEDYLVKGKITATELRSTLRSAIENAELRLALQQSEERFQTSVENMLDCFSICSAIRDQSGQIVDFRIDYLNQAALESNQMAREQIGQRLCEVFPSHIESGMFDAYCRVVETGQPLTKESLIYSDQFGAQFLIRAYDIHANKLGDGFVASWRDVTEKKHTEQALRDSEQRFRAIFDSTFQFIGLLKVDGTLIEANQTALEFGGLTSADVLNRPFWEARWWTISPATQAQLKAAIVQAAAGEFVRYEVDVLGAEDRIVTIDFSLKPVCNELGNVVLLIPEGRDITQKKQIEQALKDSEERYRAIVQDQTELICRFLPDGTLTFVNHAYSHYFETTPNQLVGQNLVQLIPEAGREVVHQQIALLNALTPNHPILTQKYTVLKPNGEISWQQWTNRAIFDATGRIIEFQAVGQDISDRVRIEAEREAAEVALRESEARLRLALEAACMGTWDWNILTGEIIWSAGMEPLFGLEPGSFDGRFETFVNCLHPDDCDRVLNAIADAVSLGEPFEIEFRVVFPDGQVRWAGSRGQVYYDDAGRPIRMAGIDLDITERKRTEETLREREALFRGVFESDLIGILFWNAAGQITDANAAFCRLTGYCREELQAGKIYYQDITPSEYHDCDAKRFETLQSTGKCSPIEKEYICKDGSRIPILLGCAFLPGSQDRGVSFVLDIREQKRLEQERAELLGETQAAHQVAEQANRTKDEFLAIVSHELRSPLNSILGWAKLLRSRQFDAEKVNFALETIERNAQAQSNLIEDLLDMSRILRGQLNLEATPVHLASIINVVVTNTQLAATAKHIQLRSHIDPEVGCILGDINRLQQIITNLVTNAVKFTPSGGQVDVSLEQIGTQVSVQVKDTGRGISADFLPYTFERFRQAENSTTRAQDGLGLGLAIVRHLVELHGGTVAVESPGLGQGATFTVMFPLIEEDVQTETIEQTETIVDLSHVKCLIVDDVPDTCEYLQFVLSDFGATVAVANSAAQAYELFQEFSPDILLSDIGMPEEDGYSLLQRIQKLSAESRISAIALTAFAKPEDRDRAFSAGFQAHLPKPVDPDKLMNAIVALLNESEIS